MQQVEYEILKIPESSGFRAKDSPLNSKGDSRRRASDPKLQGFSCFRIGSHPTQIRSRRKHAAFYRVTINTNTNERIT